MERVAEAWSQEMRRGYTRLAVLTIISKTPSTGYGIMKAFHERTLGFWNITTGSIYPILQDLEDKEYIRGEWKSRGKRRRKVYTITPAGHQLLESAIKKQQQIANTLANLIREYAHEILDTDLPPASPLLPIDLFTTIEHLKEQPIDEQIRILTHRRDQVETWLVRINELLAQLSAENPTIG
jgi:PadR family transcriptional regulator PadR